MGDFVNSIKTLSRATVKAMQAGKKAFEKTIDDAADRTYKAIEIKIPYDSEGTDKHLKSSFVKVAQIKGNRAHRYGWYLAFDGYNKRGVPYQLIANTLNRGSISTKKHGAINGTFFIDDAVKGLRGLDAKIVSNMQISMFDAMGEIK